MNTWHLRRAARVLEGGGVVVHATEGVWGLACDPFDPVAVTRLLDLKGRSASKGLIVIADDPEAFGPELNSLEASERSRVLESWPGAVTWLLPNRQFPGWITGGRDTVALRVPAHEQARALVTAAGGPLVSTSANPAGRPAPRTGLQAHIRLTQLLRRPRAVRSAPGRHRDIYLLPGQTLGRRGPSEIRTLKGVALRSGG